MSAAYISSSLDSAPTYFSGSGGVRVSLGKLVANQDGIVVDFNSASAAANQSTFSLGPGTYRIDARIASSANFSSTSPLSVEGTQIFALYDETTGSVRAYSNPFYFQEATDSGTTLGFNDYHTQPIRLAARFLITQGVHLFGIRYFTRSASGLTPYASETPPGSVVMVNEYLKIKITKT